MTRPAPLRWAALGAACALLAPAAPARAWTEADVQTARADVAVERDGRARVDLELEVRVHRGWLQGLEVAGLEPGLELDPERPAWWAPLEGTVEQNFEPDLRLREDGRAQFRFPRDRAPRRGTYRAGFGYHTRIRHEPAGPDTVRLRWTLPAWRSGLDDVVVRLHLPQDARPAAESPDTPSGVRVERTEVAGGTRITFRRTHLPRTVDWPVAVDVPADALAPALRPEAPDAPPVPTGKERAPSPPRPGPLPWALAGVLALGAAMRTATFGRLCDRARVRRRPLLPLPPWSRSLLAAALPLASLGTWAHSPATALGLLAALVPVGMERLPSPAAPPRPGTFRPVRPGDRRRARRHARRWRWLGPVLGTGRLPTSVEERLRRLERLARRLRVELDPATPVALALHLHRDLRGRWQDARLACVLPAPPDGLLRLDLTVADRVEGGRLVPEPILIAVIRAGSAADERLEHAAAWEAPVEAPGGRTTRVARTRGDAGGALTRAVRALGEPGRSDGALDPPARVDLSVRAVA